MNPMRNAITMNRTGRINMTSAARSLMHPLAALRAFLLLQAAGAHGVIRTADFNVRGLKAADFARTKPLADGVSAYGQADPTKRTVTVNNLIILAREGVVVVEAQGTAEIVKRLVGDVAKITPQPIKNVVIGSEHGDHIGGIPAFPQTATFMAHPNSKAA